MAVKSSGLRRLLQTALESLTVAPLGLTVGPLCEALAGGPSGDTVPLNKYVSFINRTVLQYNIIYVSSDWPILPTSPAPPESVWHFLLAPPLPVLGTKQRRFNRTALGLVHSLSKTRPIGPFTCPSAECEEPVFSVHDSVFGKSVICVQCLGFRGWKEGSAHYVTKVSSSQNQLTPFSIVRSQEQKTNINSCKMSIFLFLSLRLILKPGTHMFKRLLVCRAKRLGDREMCVPGLKQKHMGISKCLQF